MSWLTGLVEREKSEHQDYRCAVVAVCGDIKMKIMFTGVSLLYVSTVGRTHRNVLDPVYT